MPLNVVAWQNNAKNNVNQVKVCLEPSDSGSNTHGGDGGQGGGGNGGNGNSGNGGGGNLSGSGGNLAGGNSGGVINLKDSLFVPRGVNLI